MRNPIIYPHPHDGTDLLWTLLSVFTLTIEDQITFIGGLTNDELEVRDKMFISNSLLLKHALICREKSWVDEFSFLYDDKNEDFSEIQKSFISAIDALSDEVCVYKKDYIESKEWHLVRSVGLDISSTTQLNM